MMCRTEFLVWGGGWVRESADSHLRLVSGGRGRTDEAVWLMD